MGTVAEQSRKARQQLARALSLLQGSEGGELFIRVGIPVARAMGCLYTIELSRGLDLSKQGPRTLELVREALEALQSNPISGSAEEALGHIAGSLGLVHELSEAATVARRLADHTTAERVVNTMALDSTRPSSSPPPQYKTPKISIPHRPSPAAPSGGLDATLPIPSQKHGAESRDSLRSTQASVRSGDQVDAGDTQASARHPAQAAFSGTQPSPQQPPLARVTQGSPQIPSSKVASPPPVKVPPDALQMEASLGAHSPTNLYKGLSGNDVVDDGGLFIATYELPPLESSIWLTVHMPGGYQFEALAVVKWIREQGAGEALPGFGCVFRSLSSEARQLIYRYARNREPLFHDDL